MFSYIYHRYIENLTCEVFFIGAISTIGVTYVIYNEFFRISDYKNEINALKESNHNLRSMIGNDFLFWEILSSTSIYDMYSLNQAFANSINFTKMDFKNATTPYLNSISRVENIVGLLIDDLFCANKKYQSYNNQNLLILKNHSHLFFNQFRILIKDSVINELILSHNQNISYWYADKKSIFNKVLEFERKQVPFCCTSDFLNYKYSEYNEAY